MGGPTSTAAPSAAALASAAFASWMIHERVMPEDHVLAAVGRQLVYGGSLDTALLEGERLSVDELWALLSRATGLAIPPPELLGKKDWPSPPFPLSSSRACRAVPAGERPDGVLRLLCGEPVELGALERLATKLGRTFELFVAPEVHLEALRSVLYKRPMPARHAKLWARLVGRAGLRLRLGPREPAAEGANGGALPGTFGDARGAEKGEPPRAGTLDPEPSSTVPAAGSPPETRDAEHSLLTEAASASTSETTIDEAPSSREPVAPSPEPPAPSEDLPATSAETSKPLGGAAPEPPAASAGAPAASADVAPPAPRPTLPAAETNLTETARAAETLFEKRKVSPPRQTLRFPVALEPPPAPTEAPGGADGESSAPAAGSGATPLLTVMAMESLAEADSSLAAEDAPVSDEEAALFTPAAASPAEGSRRPTLSFPLPLLPPPAPAARAATPSVDDASSPFRPVVAADDTASAAPFDEDSVPASPYALTLDFDAEPPALDEPTAAEEARASAVAWDTFSATEALCRRARDPADPGRTLALRALRRRLNMPPVPAFRRHLVALLDGHGADESLDALADLTEIRDRDAVPAIIPLLEANDRKLVGAARSALTLLTLQDFGTKTRKWEAWWEEHRHEAPTTWLFEGLSHKEAPVRLAASEELRQITGAYFGYHFDLPKRDREDAKQRWQSWWQAMAEHEREEGGG